MYELLIKPISIYKYDYLFKTFIFKNDFNYFKTLHEKTKIKKIKSFWKYYSEINYWKLWYRSEANKYQNDGAN